MEEKNKFTGWCLQLTAFCCNYSKSYVCSLSAKKCTARKKKSVNYLMGVSELRILVASATFSIGLGAFLFYVLFSVSTMHFLLE